MMNVNGAARWPDMFKYKSLMGEEHDMHYFQRSLTVLCNYLPWWESKLPLKHFAALVLDQMNASKTFPPSK
jgi:hypothetical protein